MSNLSFLPGSTAPLRQLGERMLRLRTTLCQPAWLADMGHPQELLDAIFSDPLSVLQDVLTPQVGRVSQAAAQQAVSPSEARIPVRLPDQLPRLAHPASLDGGTFTTTPARQKLSPTSPVQPSTISPAPLADVYLTNAGPSGETPVGSGEEVENFPLPQSRQRSSSFTLARGVTPEEPALLRSQTHEISPSSAAGLGPPSATLPVGAFPQYPGSPAGYAGAAPLRMLTLPIPAHERRDESSSHGMEMGRAAEPGPVTRLATSPTRLMAVLNRQLVAGRLEPEGEPAAWETPAGEPSWPPASYPKAAVEFPPPELLEELVERLAAEQLQRWMEDLELAYLRTYGTSGM